MWFSSKFFWNGVDNAISQGSGRSPTVEGPRVANQRGRPHTAWYLMLEPEGSICAGLCGPSPLSFSSQTVTPVDQP